MTGFVGQAISGFMVRLLPIACFQPARRVELTLGSSTRPRRQQAAIYKTLNGVHGLAGWRWM